MRDIPKELVPPRQPIRVVSQLLTRDEPWACPLRRAAASRGRPWRLCSGQSDSHHGARQADGRRPELASLLSVTFSFCLHRLPLGLPRWPAASERAPVTAACCYPAPRQRIAARETATPREGGQNIFIRNGLVRYRRHAWCKTARRAFPGCGVCAARARGGSSAATGDRTHAA